MPKRDIIAIGGSAGCLEGLKQIVRAMPADLPAAVFVVIHMAPRGENFLPHILNSQGGMPCAEAREGDRIEPGKIYVASPDRHLLIGTDHLHLTRGPKEGLHRPSINITFRSAAAAYGNRVIGVLLSGMLDDGASGMWEISRREGITIIQDPSEAEFPSMPLNALQDAAIQFITPVCEIGGLITRLVNGEEMPNIDVRQKLGKREKHFSGFTCPECRGPLYVSEPGPVEFRCRVGHILSLKTLLDEHTSTQERKLYEAILALEEGAELAEYTAARMNGNHKEDLKGEAAQLRRHAGEIRKLVEERLTPSVG